MARTIPGPIDAAEMARFLETFLYREEAFLIDEIVSVDAEARAIHARLDTERPLPFAVLQRTHDGHPAHVAAGEILMATGSLGCLHAWCFHGCRWDEGWAGFGNRIHRADFKEIVRRGPPLELRSRETRTRVGLPAHRDPLRLRVHPGRQARLSRRPDRDVRAAELRRELGPEADDPSAPLPRFDATSAIPERQDWESSRGNRASSANRISRPCRLHQRNRRACRRILTHPELPAATVRRRDRRPCDVDPGSAMVRRSARPGVGGARPSGRPLGRSHDGSLASIRLFGP